jgi:hypothetical protein
MGTGPGAGEEAIVGGEEEGKGEDMVRGSGLGQEGEIEVVDVARARERGGRLNKANDKLRGHVGAGTAARVAR